MPRKKTPVDELPPPTDCQQCGSSRYRTTGGRIVCSTCTSTRSRNWYENNRDKTLKRSAEYREQNREEINAKLRTYHAENKEKIKETSRAYLDRVGPERAVLRSMISRCHNPNDSSFERYGAQGRHVGDEFKGPDGYDNFMKEVGPRPEGLTEGGIAKYTIERIDNEKGYVRGNLVWADRTTQNNNRSNNLDSYLYRGVLKSIQELADISGLTYSTLYRRLVSLGWPIDLAMETPLK